MSKLTKEQKIVSTIIAKQVIYQMKSKENFDSIPKLSMIDILTENDIKKAFSVNLTEKALDLLKNADSYKFINAIYACAKLKEIVPNIINKNTTFDTTIVHRFLLGSEKQIDKIINRTERLKEICGFDFDVWKLSILSSNFDIIFERIFKIAEIVKSKDIPRSFIEEIVIKSSNKENEEFVSKLSYVCQKYCGQWRAFAVAIRYNDFYEFEKRIDYIISHKVPILSELYAEELVSMCIRFKDDECATRAKRIYQILINKKLSVEWLCVHPSYLKHKEMTIYYYLLTYKYDDIEELCHEYRNHLALIEEKKEQRIRDFIKKERDESFKKKGYTHRQAIGHFCIGNCSVCNRTEDCPMEKKNK